MKLRIDQKTLADAARTAHRRLPAKPLQPILAGLLLDAAGDTVTLSGFDLETGTRAVLDGDIIESGRTLVSGRLLADVTAALPAGPVDVVADERELTVTTPDTTFTLPTMDHRDYPALPAPPEATGSVDGDILAAAIGHAAQASLPGKEAVGSMEGFGGVHLKADGDYLTVSASDRYRIVRHTLNWTPDGEEDSELLLPAGGFAATAKQMAGRQVRIGFPHGGGVGALSTDTLTVTSRTLAVDFPNISRFFPDPAKAAGWARVDAGALLEAVQRAGLVNVKDEQAIRLAFDHQIAVRGGAEGSTGSSRVDAEITGLDGFEIAFRPGFLASLLAPISGLAHLWFTTPKHPVLIAPVDDDTYRAVCMPVRPL